MLSLSQYYVAAGAGDPMPFQLVAAAVGSNRKWTHYMHLLLIGSWLAMLHAILLRFSLVPRRLAAVGLADLADSIPQEVGRVDVDIWYPFDNYIE